MKKYPSQTQLYLSKQQKEALSEQAQSRGMTFSGLVRWVLAQFLKNNGGKNNEN